MHHRLLNINNIVVDFFDKSKSMPNDGEQ